MYHPVSLNPDSKYETNEIDILSIYQFKDSNPKNNTLFTEKKKKQEINSNTPSFIKIAFLML